MFQSNSYDDEKARQVLSLDQHHWPDILSDNSFCGTRLTTSLAENASMCHRCLPSSLFPSPSLIKYSTPLLLLLLSFVSFTAWILTRRLHQSCPAFILSPLVPRAQFYRLLASISGFLSILAIRRIYGRKKRPAATMVHHSSFECHASKLLSRQATVQSLFQQDNELRDVGRRRRRKREMSRISLPADRATPKDQSDNFSLESVELDKRRSSIQFKNELSIINNNKEFNLNNSNSLLFVSESPRREPVSSPTSETLFDENQVREFKEEIERLKSQLGRMSKLRKEERYVTQITK